MREINDEKIDYNKEMTIIKWRNKQGDDDFEKQNYTEVK